MPQEAWILKCYLCNKFQVQLKKKTKKWQCKVCGAKQDLMTIFYKGQPSDCRINVQNMNAAEGERLKKLREQSYYEDISYNDEECENISRNEQIYNCFSNDEVEELLEEAAVELDKQCYEIEEAYSQENFEPRKFLTEASQSIRQESINVSSEKDVFDINSIDFSIKTSKNKIPENSNSQALKLSIFESNNDFDATLDF